MRRAVLFLLFSVVLLATVASPPEAVACERCYFKLDCETNPDCDAVVECRPTRFPTQGYSGCWSTGQDCYPYGELCEWTYSPLSKPSELLAMLISPEHSLSAQEEELLPTLSEP